MELNGFFGGFYKIGEWVIRLIYVNILWILFTLSGLVIVGFMPSTAALFTVMRKWMKGEDFPVFINYWKAFKEEFFKSNLVGFILGVFVLILYWDYQIIKISSSTVFQMLTIAFLVVLVLVSAMCLYIFPVMAQYNFKILEYFKYSFLFAFVSPLSTIIMIIGLFFTCIIMIIVPGLIPFFGASAIAFVIMASANLAFSKVKNLVQREERIEKLNVKYNKSSFFKEQNKENIK